jgi:glutaminyl-peptide cyclotransferase
VRRTITVRDQGREVTNLNELEYVHGKILSNIWHEDRIACISPDNGDVIGWVDLRGLLSPMFQHGPEDVLNGIAYDARQDRLFVTGKHWPALLEIRLLAK